MSGPREQLTVAALVVHASSAASSREIPVFTRHRNWSTHTSPSGNVVPFRARHRAVLDDVAFRSDDDAPGSTSGTPSRASLLKEDELVAIERQYPTGITAVQIVDAFTSRGIKFSEASFRKYVQQGLLPRSRRVGRKGKHRGSLGVYPPRTIRRINEVKQLMADGYTIEEIQGELLAYTELVENVSENLTALGERLTSDIAESTDATTRAALERELGETRRDGDRLVARMSELDGGGGLYGLAGAVRACG